MQVGDLSFQLTRKTIKHLHISVLPPDGKVRVSAPEKMTETAIRTAVVCRIPWIRQQQRRFAKQPRQSDRSMVNGESHYLWGRHHRLDVVEKRGRHQVKVAGGKIRIFVNPGAPVRKREQVLREFYRSELKTNLERYLPYWHPRVGVDVREWRIKRMKTKWGSCNAAAHRIWLNLELAKKPPECLEYILVHELVHLLERTHNERFRSHMDRLMPDWRERRDLLNSAPLAFEKWSY
jgi:predicted metal-dependent hydrolase